MCACVHVFRIWFILHEYNNTNCITKKILVSILSFCSCTSYHHSDTNLKVYFCITWHLSITKHLYLSSDMLWFAQHLFTASLSVSFTFLSLVNFCMCLERWSSEILLIIDIDYDNYWWALFENLCITVYWKLSVMLICCVLNSYFHDWHTSLC